MPLNAELLFLCFFFTLAFDPYQLLVTIIGTGSLFVYI
jgi:hypothetical protein